MSDTEVGLRVPSTLDGKTPRFCGSPGRLQSGTVGRLLYGAMESIQTTSELPRWRRRRRGGGGGAVVEAMATGKEGIADLDGEERRGVRFATSAAPPPQKRGDESSRLLGPRPRPARRPA